MSLIICDAWNICHSARNWKCFLVDKYGLSLGKFHSCYISNRVNLYECKIISKILHWILLICDIDILQTVNTIRPPSVPRVPSPQELIVHTQAILQNALIKKQLEDQKERFYKKQQERFVSFDLIFSSGSRSALNLVNIFSRSRLVLNLVNMFLGHVSFVNFF